jgi:hypothetical protein
MNFFCPVPDQFAKVITQRFGENPADYARFKLKGHNGVDYGVPMNTPIYSACNGVVLTVSDDVQGYGQYIKVAAGNYYVIYGHLSCILVKVGENVTTGQVIARSGSTGNSTGPHLHFEIRQAGLEGNGYFGAVDPLPLLTQEQPQAQAQEPSREPPPGRATVITDGLRLRNGASTAATELAKLPNGIELVIDGEQIPDGPIVWQPVKLYVAASYAGEKYIEVTK